MKLAIIPARGGSKGILRKNLKLVAGKPLVAHSIIQARETPTITRVVVSTDDTEIAAVARDYGAEAILRRPEISGDTASSESALIHALDWLESSDLRPPTSDLCIPDLVVFLQPTSPLREPDDIQRAIETLEREKADSLFSACRVEGFVWRVEKDGRVRSFSYDHLNRPRRQDAPEDLIENGSIYIFKPWVLRQFNNRLGGRVCVYRMPALNSFQIDEPADLELIEHLMRLRMAEGGNLKPEKLASRGPHQPPGSKLQFSALAAIKLLVLDFDGVMTDNRVLVSEAGQESVLCSREDGLGLEMLRKSGRVETIVLSKEANPVVTARCRKLGLECIQGCDDKLSSLQAVCAARKLGAGEIAYMGNDVNDLACLRWAGLPIAVADAVTQAKAAAAWVTLRSGGSGAVREVCDALVGMENGGCSGSANTISS